MIASNNASEVEFTRAWLAEQPKASGGEQWRCLAEALYFEARGETVKGQFAVAEVIMNRVKSAQFPGSLCSVINQGTGRKYQCQFTYTCDGNAEVIAEPRAYAQVEFAAANPIEHISRSMQQRLAGLDVVAHSRPGQKERPLDVEDARIDGIDRPARLAE